MNTISEEQKIILENIKCGFNVYVDACAGAGKSTTILNIAENLKDQHFLQITYNSLLRKEFKEKITQKKIENIEIHTYHSLAVAYFLPTAYNDTGLRKILYDNLDTTKKIPYYDVIVIDEAQDMTLLYFNFIVYFIKKLSLKIQILILGDKNQGLYEFKGSDIRFLTEAAEIWKDFSLLKTAEFRLCHLKTSYRITNQIAKFVNNVMLGENRIDACRDGDPVIYIRNSRHNIIKIVIYNIKKILEEGGLPSDIFILSASTRGVKSNVRRLENVLVENNIPCYIPSSEERDMDERVVEKKILFSTFHKTKGMQRKYVFIVGFDNSYFDIYARNLPRNICPNTLYVGVTRAIVKLFLLESDQYSTDKPLEFLKKTHNEMKSLDCVDFKGNVRNIFYDKENDLSNPLIQTHYITPTELIKFVPEPIIEEISPLLDRIFIKEPNDFENIEMVNIIETKHGFFEDVSELNGIAIPIIYYDHIHSSWNEVEVNMDEIEKSDGCDDISVSSTEEDTTVAALAATLSSDSKESIEEKHSLPENENILYKLICTNINEMKNNEHQYLKNIVNELSPICNNIQDYLYMANVHVSVQERLYFKLKQIDKDEHNWLAEDIIEQCKERMDKIIGVECTNEKPKIEKTIIHYDMEEEHKDIDRILEDTLNKICKFRFSARVDLITENTLWELKCSSKITVDNLLQVVIYSWLWILCGDCPKNVKIFNIKTGEILRLNASLEDLTPIVKLLLKGKYGVQEQMSDDDFINNCKKHL
jgi:nucleoside-triphosphatase THEP1